MKPNKLPIIGGIAWLAVLATPLGAQINPQNPATAAVEKDQAVELEQFVVTGVFTATSAQEATVSVSTIDLGVMKTQVPVSGIDLLLNVPGVFVNSSLGEIRGMVYSRGISANTSDGARGYYYVSLQEDGLPITNVSFSNSGPDYWHRPDATLLRVEAVRGGTASITSANAPGGIFNYISKTGTQTPTGEIRARFGLEGDWSPYYRGDINLGGPVGDTGWLYNVGGFYRVSDGYRPAKGYPLNNGFSIRGNLFKDYGSGSLKIYAKFQDDHNHWYEYQLGMNPTDTKQVAGLSRYSTNLHPQFSHTYPREAADNLDSFDSGDKVRSQQRAVGLDWKHDFGNGWSFNNNTKLARSWQDRNASTGISPRSLAWPNFFSAMGFQFSGGAQNGRVPAGTYRFHDRTSGALVAEVTSNGSYSVGSSAPSNPGQVVTFANLPNGNMEIAANSFNGLWTNTANAPSNRADELMNQFSVSKATDNMVFTAGFFFGYADQVSRSTTAGRAAMPLTEQPEPLGITWIPATAGSAPAGTSDAALVAVAGWNGQTVQLTNFNGYTLLGSGYGRNEVVAKNLAVFFGHKWDINDRWNIDWGFRAENYAAKGLNATGVQNPRGNWDPTYGGADGNPLTIYDARFTVPNPAGVWRFDKDVDSFSWSVASNVIINDRSSFYLRYTAAEKAPDLDLFRSYTTQFRLDNLEGKPQTIEQWELGYRFSAGRFNFVATPFWSRLGDIFSNPEATELDGITRYYPDPIYNVVTSYGLELEGNATLTQHLSLRTVFTWQESEGTVWKEFAAGVNGRADDVYRDFSGKPSDNNPDFMVNTTLSYTREKYFANLQWKHMGERAGNIANVIMLPRFNQFDVAFGYEFTPNFSLNLNVNNVLDDAGVMTWRGWGVDPADRQGYTTLPATGDRTILQFVPIPPRAYFLSATYTF
jgi:iron complex outermembrane receptor protein